MVVEKLINGMIRYTYDDGTIWDIVPNPRYDDQRLKSKISPAVGWFDLGETEFSGISYMDSHGNWSKVYPWETSPKRRKQLSNTSQKILGNLIIAALKGIKKNVQTTGR